MDEAKNDRLSQLKDAAELIGKFIVGLLGVSYIAGLLVVNIYLNRYGTFSVNLFRINYLSAGIWALLPVLALLAVLISLCGASLLVISHFKPNRVAPRAKEDWFGLALLAVVLIFCTVSFFLFALELVVAGMTWEPRWIRLIAPSSITAAYFIIAYALLVLKKQKTLARNHAVASFALTLIGVIFLFLSYLVEFSINAYGLIPSHLGGGRPTVVRLLLDVEPDTKYALSSYGIVFQKDSSQTENVHLIFLTEEECILLIHRNGIYQSLNIRRDMVQAVYRAPLGGGSSKF